MYLQQRQQRVNEICKHNEAKFDPQGVRDRFKSNGLIVFLLKQLRNEYSKRLQGVTSLEKDFETKPLK